MSARMLQRALRNNHAGPASVHNVSSDVDGSDSDGDESRAQAGNPFDLLGLEDEDVGEAGDVERESDQQSAAGSASTSSSISVSSRKSRRKKSRKKGKNEPSCGGRPVVTGDNQSVNKVFEKLNVGTGESSSSTSSRSRSDVQPPSENAGKLTSILGVDLKHLRADDELRRIFGSKVINAAERRGEGVRSQKRQDGRRIGRGVPLRKSVLVVPMEHWPRWDGGITMECVRVEGRTQYFRYQYSVSYQEVQKRYESCVASHDPNRILMLVDSHPYHVDSLLALAEVYKQMGEHQHSANLIEQCLYALECAWHPWFSPTLGSCRLEFAWDANKALFLALFRHMQHLGRRGCHRTALEVCKLLLSLDPSDPLGALFCIDYFSLRAEQYEWLEHFVEEYETDKSTSLLPNFSFSTAVARFYLEGRQYDKFSPSKSDVRTGKGSGGSHLSSGALLQRALMRHPSALKKIMVRASIKEDLSWERILSQSQFSKAPGGGPTLEHLIEIYVERNYVIWRSPELQEWLKEASARLSNISDKSLHAISGSEMASWECIRNELFSSDENEYNHLHVSEYTDSTSILPPEDMAQLNFHLHGGGVNRDEMLREVELPFEEGELQQLRSAFLGRNALLDFLQSFVPRMDHGEEASVEDRPTLLEDDGTGTD